MASLAAADDDDDVNDHEISRRFSLGNKEDEFTSALEEAEEGMDYSTVSELMHAAVEQREDFGEDWADFAEAACDSMLRMTSDSAACAAEAEAAADACNTAIMVLKGSLEEAAVVEVALALVKSLAKETSNKARFAESASEIGEAIVQAMRTHSEGEASLQDQACLAIEALATDNYANAAALCAAGAVTAVGAAKELITNERNKPHADNALRALTKAVCPVDHPRYMPKDDAPAPAAEER